GKPVLGVLPYMHGLYLEAEDALPTDPSTVVKSETQRLRVIVPVLPRISNHTDFDPLRLHPQVDLLFIGPEEPIPSADLIVLPGSKSVRDDLAWLREQGWEEAINKHLRYQGKVIGICGGFQMLGNMLHDPHGIEGDAGSTQGMGLLNVDTTLQLEKKLRNVHGTLAIADVAVSGYEIHAGITTGPALDKPAIHFTHSRDGAISDNDLLLGTYLHGLFELPSACSALLTWAGLRDVQQYDYHALREADMERLADAVEQHLDTQRLLTLLNLT
ncbi:MAG: cobyric acid synthase, partial [Cycloclasticus sp.]|nr:cobyric acid synthase [Cycloclasticus sp.]